MPSRLPHVNLWLTCVLVAIAAPATAQDFDDEESPRKPGLIATYSSAAGEAATRIDETVAFDWQSASPDPRLPAGNFSAAWRGRLWTQTPGMHRLHVYVQGSVSVKLGGKEVVAGEINEPQWLISEPLQLPFDYHPLEVKYRRTGERGRLGLYWSGPGFVLEPIPERFLFHDRTDSPSVAFERGRQLAAALRCAACHRDPADAAVASMPAPALDRLSGNISREWLVEWLTAGDRGQEPADRGQEPEATEQPVAITRRMPHFGLKAEEAAAVADWLLRLPPAGAGGIEQKETKETKKASGEAKEKSKVQEKKPKPSAEQGQRLFLTLGCLACHQQGDLGESGLFGGGDLTQIAAKRPAAFFDRWLADPASLNKHHRMPVFELTADERKSLSMWLADQGSGDRGQEPAARSQEDVGARLVAQFRCASCHELPGEKRPAPTTAKPLAEASDWAKSCAFEARMAKDQPSYRLNDDDRSALQAYFSAMGGAASQEGQASPAAVGRDLLVQLNCLACHQREGIDRKVSALPARLQDKLAAVAELHSDLAKELPAMTPPALNSVGDKLHDSALVAAIRSEGPPHRPYLLARMPKFNLTDDQLTSLIAYFVSTDRIPRGVGVPPAQIRAGEMPTPQLAAAGPRLVTTDGFGCTSCHQVGSVKADKAPLNARGPNLSLLDKRIRREWFDRWCNGPARIVPRMEMPSVQVPVRGVLNDNVYDQLAAVWHTLNTPGFEPPEPNPVRVLRLSGVPDRKESPIILHDVVKDGDKTYLFPLVIGLPNRHNILFDLETNRLAAWWLGDTARQRTKGKSWYWEVGAKSIDGLVPAGSEVVLLIDGTPYYPEVSKKVSNADVNPKKFGEPAEEAESPGSQFAAELEMATATFGSDPRPAPAFVHQLTFGLPGERRKIETFRLRISNLFRALSTERGSEAHGFTRVIAFGTGPKGAEVQIELVSQEAAANGRWDKGTRTFHFNENLSIQVKGPSDARWSGDGSIAFTPALWKPEPALGDPCELVYRSTFPIDQYLTEPLPTVAIESLDLSIAPGFEGRRLPLADDITPTALAWKPDGRLTFTTLKGQLIAAVDADGDGLEDSLTQIADGLATPYGLASANESDDVVTKTGLLRIANGSVPGLDARRVVAAGWGVTDDYHDWAVGLIRGDRGEYYLALPCQQDKRSEAAAQHRGQILKLVPRNSISDPFQRAFNLEVLSSGYRFPMGMARNRAGDLFVTDNQGNYNPFNELNHVRPGKHFGFINANEKENGFKAPPLEEPAINLPHPWTRSVNGICFLDTPVGWVKDAQRPMTHADSTRHVPNAPDANGQSTPRGSAPAAGLTHPTQSAFGPLEGHLIGCEYDTRRLIRMTLQKIGDTYQGAAYPLSIPPDDVEQGLLGPIVCAVSPRGELYVGEIRDSGWGAGNNIGQIVKIKIEPDKLPCGIAEMRATKTGFTLDFFQPVDAKQAAVAANYSLQSYRRISTPAYGGPDVDRRTETIEAADVSGDRKRVTLTLPDLRTGFVYELKLKNLAPNHGMFHPDEAHFTLRQIPE